MCYNIAKYIFRVLYVIYKSILWIIFHAECGNVYSAYLHILMIVRIIECHLIISIKSEI